MDEQQVVNEKEDRQEVVRDLRRDRVVTNGDVTNRDRDRAHDMVAITQNAQVTEIVEVELAHEVPVELVTTNRRDETKIQEVNEPLHLFEESEARIEADVIEVPIRRTDNDSQRQKLLRQNPKRPTQTTKKPKHLLVILTIRSKVYRLHPLFHRLRKVTNLRLRRSPLPQPQSPILSQVCKKQALRSNSKKK